MSVVQDLQGARNELVSRGRCRLNLLDGDGKVCALGAIAAVVDPLFNNDSWDAFSPRLSPRGHAAVAELRKHLPAEYRICEDADEFHEDIYNFNDHQVTTDQDVLNLYDKALADLGGLA